jgi:hypothetical protein
MKSLHFGLAKAQRLEQSSEPQRVDALGACDHDMLGASLHRWASAALNCPAGSGSASQSRGRY